MTKQFHPILSKLTASFCVAGHKLQVLHTDTAGALFLPVHGLLGDVYEYLLDNVDRLKERALIMGMTTPYNLVSYLKISAVKELAQCVDMNQAIQIAIADLRIIESQLDEASQATADDLVTQNKLIEFNNAIGKFRRKLEMTTAV